MILNKFSNVRSALRESLKDSIMEFPRFYAAVTIITVRKWGGNLIFIAAGLSSFLKGFVDPSMNLLSEPLCA